MPDKKKHAGGRPLSIHTPERFAELADAFFAECDLKDEPYTITGLALAVGLSGRKELCDYEYRPEFSPAVKSAKSRVENYNERMLQKGQTTGAIFALKNFGWSDRQDVSVSGHTTSDVRSIGFVAVGDPAQLSKTCEALRLWKLKRNEVLQSESLADAEASPSPLRELQERAERKSEEPPPSRKQW